MSTDPNEETIRAAVLRDADGHYFVVPLDLIQKGRVPVEQIPALEQVLTEQIDVQGFLGRGLPLPQATPATPKPPSGGTGIKPVNDVPAATLLLPYFEINLTKGTLGALFS